MNHLIKSSQKKTFLGVVGRSSDYFGLDYTWARLIFLVLVFLSSGILLLAYFVSALFLPRPTKEGIAFKRANLLQVFWGNIKVLFKTIWYYLRQMFRHLRLVLSQARFARLYGAVFTVLGMLWWRQDPGVWAIVLISIGLFVFGSSLNPPQKPFWRLNSVNSNHYH